MKRLPLLLLCVLALAACGSTEEEERVKVSGGCPQVAIARDLSIYQNPPAADENNLVISVRMGRLKGVCAVDDDGREVEAGFDVVAQKGMNTAGHRAAVPFFISVLDGQEQVVKKEVYEIPIVFEGNETIKTVNIPVNPRIGIPAGENAENYRVLIGFQLSPTQLNANQVFFNQIPVVSPSQE